MTIKDLLRGGKSLFDKREKELLSQIDNTQKQLQISQKETKKARRKVYAYERDGKFQCVTHIIRQTKANISSDTLNKMLLSKGYIERKEVVVKKYFPNDVETISDEDGSVLVHKDTALKVMEDFDVEFESDSQMVMEF